MRYHRFRIERDAPTQEQYGSIVVGIPIGVGQFDKGSISTTEESIEQFRRKIVGLSEQYPRYGYRRITALLRRTGKRVNPKRVQRVRRQAGFQVSKRQRRMRRLGPSSPKRLRAQQRNEVWSWDLLYDQTAQGRTRAELISSIDRVAIAQQLKGRLVNEG